LCLPKERPPAQTQPGGQGWLAAHPCAALASAQVDNEAVHAARARCVETQRAWSATNRGQSAATDCVERGTDACAPAASYPLPAPARPAFLEHCARELANVSELGDGILHRMIMRVQKLYFDPPDLDGRMPRVSKWER
jgi:hypothetical protein